MSLNAAQVTLEEEAKELVPSAAAAAKLAYKTAAVPALSSALMAAGRAAVVSAHP